VQCDLHAPSSRSPLALVQPIGARRVTPSKEGPVVLYSVLDCGKTERAERCSLGLFLSGSGTQWVFCWCCQAPVLLVGVLEHGRRSGAGGR